MRIINYNFIEYLGKISPETIGRPDEGNTFATICVDLAFAKEWSGTKDKDSVKAFFKLFEFDMRTCNDVTDSSRFVKDALDAGKVAFIHMPRNGCYEGYFIPEHRPDRSVAALIRSNELDSLEEDAERHINNVLFDEDDAPDTYELADAVIHEKYPNLNYQKVLDSIDDLIGNYENSKDCNCAENDTWRQCVEALLRTLNLK